MEIVNITPTNELTVEELHNYIAECASVVRDKTPKSAEKLFSRLMTESIGEKASRVLEFIPCTISQDLKPTREVGDVDGVFQYFGFDKSFNYYTNARELLNWGWTLVRILQYVDFTHYKVFKCEAPYFIYGQVSTHNQLTTISHSQRYADCDRGYWKPNEVAISQDIWNMMVAHTPRVHLVDVFKGCGVTRKEVFDRGSDMLQNRVFTIGGYTNNPNAWQHFVDQRLDSHTQLETRGFVFDFLEHLPF